MASLFCTASQRMNWCLGSVPVARTRLFHATLWCWVINDKYSFLIPNDPGIENWFKCTIKSTLGSHCPASNIFLTSQQLAWGSMSARFLVFISKLWIHCTHSVFFLWVRARRSLHIVTLYHLPNSIMFNPLTVMNRHCVPINQCCLWRVTVPCHPACMNNHLDDLFR